MERRQQVHRVGAETCLPCYFYPFHGEDGQEQAGTDQYEGNGSTGQFTRGAPRRLVKQPGHVDGAGHYTEVDIDVERRHQQQRPAQTLWRYRATAADIQGQRAKDDPVRHQRDVPQAGSQRREGQQAYYQRHQSPPRTYLQFTQDPPAAYSLTDETEGDPHSERVEGRKAGGYKHL
ncbi:hypothetical protein D3C81_1083040 [compost metagenome]